MEEPKDPRKAIIQNIDITKCRVELSIFPVVLLCGGRTSEHLNDPESPVLSFRDALTQSIPLPSYEIFRPEEITNWHSDGIYKNLMDFEADLASICSLVVIILESPGSIAELGAFSQLKDLSTKLIVIKSNIFSDDDSFINLGILRHIKKSLESSVKTYPWDILEPFKITNEVIADVIVDIEDELNKLKKSQVFKLEDNSHIIVLICELISLFVALKVQEILYYLQNLGIDISKEKVKSKLFLLEKFRIIKREEYGDATFYIDGEIRHHKLRLVFSKDYHIDSLRISTECREYYTNSNKNRHRSRVIRNSISGSTE